MVMMMMNMTKMIRILIIGLLLLLMMMMMMMMMTMMMMMMMMTMMMTTHLFSVDMTMLPPSPLATPSRFHWMLQNKYNLDKYKYKCKYKDKYLGFGLPATAVHESRTDVPATPRTACQFNINF